jgi:hypothetical protein
MHHCSSISTLRATSRFTRRQGEWQRRSLQDQRIEGCASLAQDEARRGDGEKYRSLMIGTNVVCARRCANPLDHESCFYKFRANDLASQGQSNLVEWLYVDPNEKTLFFLEAAWADGGERWGNEAIKE